MAFKPSSTIYLCNVPFDSTYKNEVYFATLAEQQNYFKNKVVKTFSNYLTVRKTLPDGSLQSSVKVDANIDLLQSLPCNYMYYQNANHGIKIFYAFIVDMIYINEGTTEIVFKTDVYQTWLTEVTLKPSYVVREHSETDLVGEHLVPEKFNFQDYDYEEAIVFDSLNEWGYLVATTEQRGSDGSRGKEMSGIYQGLYFYYYHNANNLNDFLDEIEEEGGDCVQSITVIPKFCVSGNSIGATETDRENGEGWLYYSGEPASHSFDIDVKITNRGFSEYPPRNNKLFTSPFFNLVITNHNGEEAVYNIEDFYNNYPATTPDRKFSFTMKGDVSINPTVTLYPLYYKGIAENYDCGISISGFPQSAFNSDTFKLWLAKNQFGVALDTAGNIGQIVTGVVGAVATGGVGGVLGASQVISGVQGVLGTMNTVYQASKEPNKSHSGSTKNNLLTAMKKNKFDIYYRTIKREWAIMVDDFFTMYGYQTNRIKVPNISSRPYFNYVQTIDVNIVGGIPSKDMEQLKAMYNRGVTFWKPDATVGDYSVDNSPV